VVLFHLQSDHPGVILEGCVTAEAAAELTGYNIQHIRRLTWAGKLDALRVGRSWLIKIKSLEAYLAAAEENDSRFGPRVPAQPDNDDENASA
jgi:excisionase family DNA binding protein